MTASPASLPSWPRPHSVEDGQTWAQPSWRLVGPRTADLVVADRSVLGTTARVACWPANRYDRVLGVVDTVLTELDLQASRFRPDSEIAAIHAAGGGTFTVSAGLAEAISVALTAARWTEGLVDPTICRALCRLGYDRDFARITDDADSGGSWFSRVPVPGWRSVRLTGRLLRLPTGVWLDLGATGKGLGADRAAHAASAVAGVGGVLVSLGGDLALAGDPPAGGWPVLVADDHRYTGPSREHLPVQLVRIRSGALATSSTSLRRWRRGGQQMHHIVDPRTGRPATGPWRTVSVAAACCAAANAAATAAIVAGRDALRWLAATGLPARLVAADGTVTLVGAWPARDGGLLQAGPASSPVCTGSEPQ